MRDLLPTRLFIASFLMGTLNNLTFVVNAAGATNLLPGAVGVVYIINVAPELLLKGTAPYWWHFSGYTSKIIFAGVCFAANILLVSSGLDVPTGWKLVGVALADVGGGLGEASVLALSQSYTETNMPLRILIGYGRGRCPRLSHLNVRAAASWYGRSAHICGGNPPRLLGLVLSCDAAL